MKEIELKNYFGFLPTDVLSLGERFEVKSEKEIGEECVEIIRNFLKINKFDFFSYTQSGAFSFNKKHSQIWEKKKQF